MLVHRTCGRPFLFFIQEKPGRVFRAMPEGRPFIGLQSAARMLTVLQCRDKHDVRVLLVVPKSTLYGDQAPGNRPLAGQQIVCVLLSGIASNGERTQACAVWALGKRDHKAA